MLDKRSVGLTNMQLGDNVNSIILPRVHAILIIHAILVVHAKLQFFEFHLFLHKWM